MYMIFTHLAGCKTGKFLIEWLIYGNNMIKVCCAYTRQGLTFIPLLYADGPDECCVKSCIIFNGISCLDRIPLK